MVPMADTVGTGQKDRPYPQDRIYTDHLNQHVFKPHLKEHTQDTIHVLRVTTGGSVPLETLDGELGSETEPALGCTWFFSVSTAIM